MFLGTVCDILISDYWIALSFKFVFYVDLAVFILDYKETSNPYFLASTEIFY
jgi:hypothetical protein